MPRTSGNRGYGSMDRDRESSRESYRSSGYDDYNNDYDDDYRGRSDYDEYDDYESNSRGRRSYNDDDDDDRRGNGGGRGFASMDRDEVRRIAAKGGRASHSGRGYDDDDDRRGRYSDYDDDDRRGRRSYDDDDDDRRGGNGGRGFASMDRDEVRRIAAMGGRASHGGGRGYDDDDDRRGRYSDYDDRRGRRSYDDDDDRRGGNGGGRGFASMDREEVRRIASMGGRTAHERGTAHEWDSREAREAGHRGGMASHGGGRGRSNDDDYDYDDRRGNSNGGGRNSRRGFAAMSREERSRIAAKGGHASHGGGRGRGNSNR